MKRTEEDGWDSDSDFRRLRAYVQGFAFDHLMFKVAYDFEAEEVKDVYAGLRGLGPLGAVQGGYMKEPFSLEQAMSLRYHTFLERSLANALVPRRNTGALATSTHFDKRLRWAAGIFFLDESLAETDESLEGVENDWEIAARVNWVPVSSKDGSRLVMAGCSYSHIFSDARGLTIGQRERPRLRRSVIDGDESRSQLGDRLGAQSLGRRLPEERPVGDRDNRWTVPIGLGINRTFQFGKVPVRIGAEFHYNVVRPDTVGADWDLRIFIIPAAPSALFGWMQ